MPFAHTQLRARGVPVGGGLPDWVPAPGTFANVGTSTLVSARPSGWPAGDNSAMFSNWSGAVWAPEFGSRGGFVTHGSGHLSLGSPMFSGVWVWDVATLTWVGRNVPSQPLLETGGANPPPDYNIYYESTIHATLGHTYAPHTYDGLVYIPPALANNNNGKLARFCMPGANASGAKCLHVFDLDSQTAPPTRPLDVVNTITNSYPGTAMDRARGGIWCITSTGIGGVGFVNVSNWVETRWSGVNFNTYGNQNLIYVPTRDCLVAIGTTGAIGNLSLSVRVCPIVGGVPQAWTLVTTTGTPPADSRCGGVWSTLLDCIVSYEANGSYAVHKLAIPANLTTGSWAWSTETLAGVGGAAPSKTPAVSNGAWSRFVEAPELRCFLWADSVTQVTQAWRLTGM